jgi:hypothetical protein
MWYQIPRKRIADGVEIFLQCWIQDYHTQPPPREFLPIHEQGVIDEFRHKVAKDLQTLNRWRIVGSWLVVMVTKQRTIAERLPKDRIFESMSHISMTKKKFQDSRRSETDMNNGCLMAN